MHALAGMTRSQFLNCLPKLYEKGVSTWVQTATLKLLGHQPGVGGVEGYHSRLGNQKQLKVGSSLCGERNEIIL
jgi:hypothetical protein